MSGVEYIDDLDLMIYVGELIEPPLIIGMPAVDQDEITIGVVGDDGLIVAADNSFDANDPLMLIVMAEPPITYGGGGGGGPSTAALTTIVDSGNHYSSGNVEGALSEAAIVLDATTATASGAAAAASTAQTSANSALSNLAAHIADSSAAHPASAVSVLDAAGKFAANDVEAALLELVNSIAAIISGSLLASNNLSDVLNPTTARTNLGVDTAISTAVTTAINNLIASAPGTLNTLDELAAALGDDPNLSATLTTLIGTKVASSLFNAHTILAATTDDTPAPVTIAEQTLLGRITGGNIAAITVAQIKTMLAYTAANVPIVDSGNLYAVATDVEGALAEIMGVASSLFAALIAHSSDTTGIHGISNTADLVYTADLTAAIDALPEVVADQPWVDFVTAIVSGDLVTTMGVAKLRHTDHVEISSDPFNVPANTAFASRGTSWTGDLNVNLPATADCVPNAVLRIADRHGSASPTHPIVYARDAADALLGSNTQSSFWTAGSITRPWGMVELQRIGSTNLWFAYNPDDGTSQTAELSSGIGTIVNPAVGGVQTIDADIPDLLVALTSATGLAATNLHTAIIEMLARQRTARLTADWVSTANSATLQDVTGLALTVEASTVYRVEATVAVVGSATGATGVQFGWKTGLTGTVLDWGIHGTALAVAGAGVESAMRSRWLNGGYATAMTAGATTGFNMFLIRGIVAVSTTAGTLQLQAAQAVAESGQSVTIKRNSHLVLSKI